MMGRMMEDLVQWYLQQLDEDERIARAARDAEFCKDGRWVVKGPFGEGLGGIHSEPGEAILGEEENVPFAIADHAVRHDPARVLREVEANRRIVRECTELLPEDALGVSSSAETMLRTLVTVYADHLGYLEKWRP